MSMHFTCAFMFTRPPTKMFPGVLPGSKALNFFGGISWEAIDALTVVALLGEAERDPGEAPLLIVEDELFAGNIETSTVGRGPGEPCPDEEGARFVGGFGGILQQSNELECEIVGGDVLEGDRKAR